eukprot:26062-Amphidinium_carterae.1
MGSVSCCSGDHDLEKNSDVVRLCAFASSKEPLPQHMLAHDSTLQPCHVSPYQGPGTILFQSYNNTASSRFM